jgi:addiction module HigA family antidote
VLREAVLPALDMSVSVAAKDLGVSRQTPHAILSGHGAVTPAMALRLGKFCGNGLELWLNLQRAYDLWHAEREMADELARIPTHRAA